MIPTHTIDAAGKRLGRVASQAAHLLMGKHTSAFEKHHDKGVAVVITNAAKLSITEKRASGTLYSRFSGYPGGLKQETMKRLMARKGVGEILKHAVRGMLPNNKLRPGRLKRLTIES